MQVLRRGERGGGGGARARVHASVEAAVAGGERKKEADLAADRARC
jgi:hypothetical protein